MKTLNPKSIAVFGLIAALVWPMMLAAQVSQPEDIVFPDLPEVGVPQPERFVLKNGMVVILLEDHELPLVEAQAVIRTGSRLEPADQVGLASLAAQVMRSGGTQNISSDELDDFLEGRAATIEAQASEVTTSAVMNCLKDDFAEVLPVFSDMLRRPAFEEDKLSVAKNQANAAIARQNDDSGQILSREFQELIYGQDSPYSRSMTYASMNNIAREHLVDWHSQYLHPNRIILGVVGDFKTKEMLKTIKQVFGDWSKGPKVQDPQADYLKTPKPGIYFVEKNDVTQSNIRIGHLSIQKDHPDFYAVEVMNQVLGGSFAARLFSRVRSQKGLAYNVFGLVASQWDYPGIFLMSMSTKTETTAAAIDALLEEAKNMTSEPPTDEEVAKAKTSMLNSFVFRTDSSSKILQQQLQYEYFDYPLDTLERYRRGIENVTTAQVREAAKKHIRMDDFAILVVGPKEGVDRPLSEFGEVQVVDITIPEPEGPEVEMTAEGQERGNELIAKAVQAIGGAEALASVNSLVIESQMEAVTPQGNMQLNSKGLVDLPDRMRWEVQLPFGTMVQVLNGENSFAQGPQGNQPLNEQQRQQLAASLYRLPVVLLQHRDHDSFKAVSQGTEELDGKTVEQVYVEVAGFTNTLSIDPESGQILAIQYRGQGMTGAPGDLQQIFSDFRPVENLVMAHASKTTFNGDLMLQGTNSSIIINGPVEDSAFEMP